MIKIIILVALASVALGGGYGGTYYSNYGFHALGGHGYGHGHGHGHGGGYGTVKAQMTPHSYNYAVQTKGPHGGHSYIHQSGHVHHHVPVAVGYGHGGYGHGGY